MRTYRLTALAALLFSASALAEAPYYNPANAASSNGKTLGYELYKTIGCPGRGLLEPPCAAPAAPQDADQDGVLDAQDRCPGTPLGRRVDGDGCELDSDKDGVLDAQDRCPGTPAGRRVDGDGCELDSDKDGVLDAQDRCPGTPAGRRVDAAGCEPDSDKDGVVDALDRCPGTPAGRTVDAAGCEPDGDKDGVVDALDRCPATPAGDRVDDQGCTLLKTIVLKGVNFDNDSAELRPDALLILDQALATLKRYPGIKVEIAGHTDSRSDDAHNQQLSERRAKAVMDYFAGKGVPADNLSAKGYGEAQPVADNDSEDGRAKNRRVEMRILN